MSEIDVLDQRLRLGHGFTPTDDEWVKRTLASLNTHLAGWQMNQVELELTVKERDQRDQKVTLEAWLSGWPPFIATSHEPDLDHALVEVRKDMIRQIDDAKSRREPRKHDKHKPGATQ